MSEKIILKIHFQKLPSSLMTEAAHQQFDSPYLFHYKCELRFHLVVQQSTWLLNH